MFMRASGSQNRGLGSRSHYAKNVEPAPFLA